GRLTEVLADEPVIESVPACRWSCTADSAATRGHVTRRATLRNMRSKSAAVGTLRALPIFWNQSSIRWSRPHVQLGRGKRTIGGLVLAALPGTPPVEVLDHDVDGWR